MTFCRTSTFLLRALAISLLLALAGCGGDGDAEGDVAPATEAEVGLAPLPERFEGAWSGVLPCIDCEGIDVTLELQREAGAVGGYRLVETYLGAIDAPGFETSGEWREDACVLAGEPGRCITLVESGQRWFRHVDGSLQSTDAKGRPLDPDGARLLRR